MSFPLVHRFQSLRVRLLLPLLAVAFVASVGVAMASYSLGERWAQEQVQARYRGIASTLAEAAFPLNQQVVELLAEMTKTDLVTIDADGLVVNSTLGLSRGSSLGGLRSENSELSADRLLVIGDRSYRYGVFDRRGSVIDGGRRVVVLFDEAGLQASRYRMASLPLLTGLSTVILLTSVTLWFAGRLVRRLSRLQQRVRRLASGDFDTELPIGVEDEVGQLGVAVTQMTVQLQQMRTSLHRQQGEKLLHQVAGGLAHQLRNSLTGARMAVELHRHHCKVQDDTLGVALSQLEETERHVRRLLTVASGRQEDDQKQEVLQCLEEAMGTLTATAKHLRVSMRADFDAELSGWFVSDGPSLNAAVTNLVLNALHEGQVVLVHAALRQNELSEGANDRLVAASQADSMTNIECQIAEAVLTVVDDGFGPPEEVANEIFEPFVTSKPEGLGLGLPLVARSARRLGGEVCWNRVDDHTRFELRFQLSRIPTAKAGSY